MRIPHSYLKIVLRRTTPAMLDATEQPVGFVQVTTLEYMSNYQSGPLMQFRINKYFILRHGDKYGIDQQIDTAIFTELGDGGTHEYTAKYIRLTAKYTRLTAKYTRLTCRAIAILEYGCRRMR